MCGIDLVGVGIVKNYPTPTGRPGGGTLPPRPVASRVGELCDQYGENLWRTQSSIKLEGPGQYPFTVFEFLQKNRNFTKNDQNAKKHKNRQNDVIFTI